MTGAWKLGSVTRVLPWLEVGAVTVAIAATAPLYAGCFTGHTYVLPVVLAAPAGAALPIVAAVRRWGWLQAVTAAVLGCAVYLTGAVLAPTFRSWHPVAATWTALRDGLIGGWLRLLTSGVPMDVTPVLLMTPVLLTFGCGWLAATACLRTQRVLLPAGSALLALLAAVLIGGTQLTPSLPLTGCWLLLVLSEVLLRGNRVAGGGQPVSQDTAAEVGLGLPAKLRRTLLGRVAFGIPMIVLVVAAGVGGTAALPIASGQHRFDVRGLVAQPIQVQQTLTPLATLQSQLMANPARPLFTVSGLTGRTDRLRVAVLDTFDGATWTAPDARFLPAGHQLPADPLTPTANTVTVTVTVTTANNQSNPFLPFLPTVGAPVRLNGTGLGYSARTGTVVDASPSGGAPVSYTVSGVLPGNPAVPDAAALAAPPDGPIDLALPTPVPTALISIADSHTELAATPYLKAKALASYLQGLPYNLGAKPGHSYGAVTRMLDPNRTQPADRQGFAEQHAAAFVVLARILGIPARVAVGYLIDPATVTAGKTVTITTRNAHAWAEIPVQGYGWIPIETVDLTKLSTAFKQPQADPPPVGRSDQPGPVKVQGGPGPGPGPAGSDAAALVGKSTVVGGLTVVGLVLLPGALIIGEKHRRRWRRRHTSSTSGRIIGAWREAQDRLIEHGLTVTHSDSLYEIAANARRVVGEPALAAMTLAPLVSAALFAPDEPAAHVANQAWDLEQQLHTALAGSRHKWRRITTQLDPRPLMPTRPLRTHRLRTHRGTP